MIEKKSFSSYKEFLNMTKAFTEDDYFHDKTRGI
jgi:hypothetical protein